jgi:hypothetical protein
MATKFDDSLPAVVGTAPGSAPAASVSGIQSIVTHRDIAASAERVWDSLQFYEELDRPPPFLLRLLLPRPERKVTPSAVVGEATTLPYEGGHYARRITKLEVPSHYEFDVIDQRLASDRGVALLSGSFSLRPLNATHTDLAITTRYVSGIRPRWLAQPVEAAVCRRLHRHLLDSIETRVRSA